MASLSLQASVWSIDRLALPFMIHNNQPLVQVSYWKTSATAFCSTTCTKFMIYSSLSLCLCLCLCLSLSLSLSSLSHVLSVWSLWSIWCPVCTVCHISQELPRKRKVMTAMTAGTLKPSGQKRIRRFRHRPHHHRPRYRRRYGQRPLAYMIFIVGQWNWTVPTTTLLRAQKRQKKKTTTWTCTCWLLTKNKRMMTNTVHRCVESPHLEQRCRHVSTFAVLAAYVQKTSG